jgi:hypothetical protein
MQIGQAKKDELALIVHALRAVYVADLEAVRSKLLSDFERELSTRYGVKVAG